MTSQYAQRDPRRLEPYFSRHMDAMTSEDLHDKAAIAAELAFRDQQIAALQVRLARTLLKYAPDELSDEELIEWAANQVPTTA